MYRKSNIRRTKRENPEKNVSKKKVFDTKEEDVDENEEKKNQ